MMKKTGLILLSLVMIFVTIPITAVQAALPAAVTFYYTGDVQTYTVPNGVGTVLIEVWGAQGGGSSKGPGGLGGYAKGSLAVTPGQMLYVYVGGRGTYSSSSYISGGWNGGGDANRAGSGGGASDVRVGNTSLNKRVIVAGGGGGGGHYDEWDIWPGEGGSGGGTIGGDGEYRDQKPSYGRGGTQTTAGIGGSFGYGGYRTGTGYLTPGGGGGWYGGGYGEVVQSDKAPHSYYDYVSIGGGGGSSYIGGVMNGSTEAGVRYGHGLVKITPLHPYISIPSATPYALGWSNSAGRGYAIINWSKVTGATGYKLWLFDGYTYRSFDVGNVTSVDTRNLKLYPSDSTINSYATNTRTEDIFNHVKGSLDLRDDPRNLYRSAVNGSYNDRTNYFVRVSAYFSDGETGQSTTTTFTLPNRTDKTKPIGSIKVNNGDNVTYSTEVTINLSGIVDPLVANYTSTTSDDASGLHQMQFSNDNKVWSTWESFKSSKTWDLSPGSGEKVVYVRVKDKAGNISDPISSGIVLKADETPPNVKIKINNGATLTTNRKVSLNIFATDDITPATSLSYGVSSDGVNWKYYNGSSWVSGWSPNGNYLTNLTWDLGSSKGYKYVFVRVKDASGNTAYTSSSILYSTDPKDTTGLTSSVFDISTGRIKLSPDVITDELNVAGKVRDLDNGQGVSENMIIANTTSVSLTITGNFGANKITQVRYSHDGVNFSPWEQIDSNATSINKYVNFKNQGVQRVSFQFMNVYGVESKTLSLAYFVDTEAPDIISLKTANGATATSTGSIQLSISVRDDVSKLLKYRVNNGAWKILATNGIITISVSQGLNPYTIEVVDSAGNVSSETISIWGLD